MHKNSSVVDRLKPADQRHIGSNSIERVINTTISIISRSRHPDAQLNYEDWEALRHIVVFLWNDARNECFIHNLELQQQADAKPRQLPFRYTHDCTGNTPHDGFRLRTLDSLIDRFVSGEISLDYARTLMLEIVPLVRVYRESPDYPNGSTILELYQTLRSAHSPDIGSTEAFVDWVLAQYRS